MANKRNRKTRRRRISKTRKQRRGHGGALHPASTVVIKPNDYSPFIMTTPEEAENLFESRNVYKL